MFSPSPMAVDKINHLTLTLTIMIACDYLLSLSACFRSLLRVGSEFCNFWSRMLVDGLPGWQA